MKTPKCTEPGCRRFAEANSPRCKQHDEAYARFWEAERHNQFVNGKRVTPRSSDDQ